MDILSYNDSNYSDRSSRGARVPPLPPPTFLFLDPTLIVQTNFGPEGPEKNFLGHPNPLTSRSGLGTELHLFNNAFLWYSGYKVG